MINTYIILAISICAEALATTMMKASDSFTRILPGTAVVAGYAISFWICPYISRHLLSLNPLQ
ncbi:hypothetical protein HEO09_024770, partial [Escherichia coli]|nr:hypothetical protein [Escherichia coli]MBB8214739.1 hypothetical protein [Escherichia coli]